MEQALAGAGSGFAAYPLVDPGIIGDVAVQGSLNRFGTALLTGSINLVVTPQMPVYPGAPHNTASGPDPTVSIPSTLQLGSDGTVTVPVDIDDPHPAGSTGMTQATLAVSYDPAIFSVSTSDIQLGSVPASGSGWTLQSTVDPAAGQIGVTIWSPTPIASSTAGSLVTIVFHRSDTAASGTTAIDLVPSVDPAGSGVILTQVDDNQGPYTLTPAPTDGYDPQIDGLVSLGAADAGAAAGSASVGAMALPVWVPLAGLSSSAAGVVAGPAAPLSTGAAGPVSVMNVSPHLSTSAGAARVPWHLADGLFTTLGRGRGERRRVGDLRYGADPALPGALAAPTSAVGPAQANL